MGVQYMKNKTIILNESARDDLRLEQTKSICEKNNIEFDEDFYEDILFIDTTKTGKYKDWLQKQYRTGNLTIDNYDTVKQGIAVYNQLADRNLISIEEKDITKLSIQQMIQISNTNKQKLNINSSERKKEQEIVDIKNLIPSDKLYETNNWYITYQETREEQVKFGENTKWCIQQTNTQGKTLRDVYHQEFVDIWLKDQKLSNMLDNMLRYMNIGNPDNPEEKFELFYQQQIEQQSRFLGRSLLDEPDPVSTAYELLFDQYLEFEKKRGDNKIWILINKKNPFIKYCFVFGIYEFRNQINEEINLKDFFNDPNNTELIQFFNKYRKQKSVIVDQLNGVKLPTYVDVIKKEFNL